MQDLVRIVLYSTTCLGTVPELNLLHITYNSNVILNHFRRVPLNLFHFTPFALFGHRIPDHIHSAYVSSVHKESVVLTRVLLNTQNHIVLVLTLLHYLLRVRVDPIL